MRTLLALVLLFVTPLLLPTETQAAAVANAPGSVVGIVLDANGDTVADARVAIRMTTASGRTYTLETRTDRRGRFEFARLPQSRGVIGAAKRGVGRDRDRLGVRSGNTTRVRLQLS